MSSSTGKLKNRRKTSRSTLVVKDLTRSSAAVRVEARVAGAPLWFESDDDLSVSVETFATAALMPAMAAQKTIELPDAVDEVWSANQARAQQLINDWWGYPGISIDAPRLQLATSGAQLPVAMFFTGGVDSLYSLRQSPEVSALIYVEGFDIPLSDPERRAKTVAELKSVASDSGLELVRIRTNFRDHPALQVPWPIHHGAALGSVGHLLTHRFAKILIAGSDIIGPHGSHPDLDQCWSSSRLSFIYHGAGVSRIDKVRAIADDPLALKHLRVCWENLASDSLNCGRCEKCLRTTYQFIAANPDFLDMQVCFPHGDVAAKLGALEHIPAHLELQWRAICEQTNRPETTRLLQQLEAREGPFQEKSEGWRKRARRRFKSLLS